MIHRLARKFAAQTGKQFKETLRAGTPQVGIFLNSGSPVVAEQLSQSSYDWLLVDTQHGPTDRATMHAMLSGIGNGSAFSIVRVGSYKDREGIQQSLDAGAGGILVPYVNNKAEVQQAVDCCLYPVPSQHTGNRSIYFPQRSTNIGLLEYTGDANEHVFTSIQVETADCLNNLEDIVTIPELDMVFLGSNDLAMSMGLFEKYEFPHMFTSPELLEAIDHIVATCRKAGKIQGAWAFGTGDVEARLNQGFDFISIGNDLHHVLTANTQFINEWGEITKKVGKNWTKKDSALV